MTFSLKYIVYIFSNNQVKLGSCSIWIAPLGNIYLSLIILVIFYYVRLQFIPIFSQVNLCNFFVTYGMHSMPHFLCSGSVGVILSNWLFCLVGCNLHSAAVECSLWCIGFFFFFFKRLMLKLYDRSHAIESLRGALNVIPNLLNICT